ESRVTRWRADNVGFIFQLYNLIPVLTAFENVELPLLLTRLSRRKRRENVMTALRVVGLAGREDHFPRQLSGRQEQRVAIARAVAPAGCLDGGDPLPDHDPRLVLLVERRGLAVVQGPQPDHRAELAGVRRARPDRLRP